MGFTPPANRECQGSPGGGLGLDMRLSLQRPGGRLGHLVLPVWDAVRREGWAGLGREGGAV